MSLLDPSSAAERLNSSTNLANRFGKKEEPKVIHLPNPRAGKRPELPEEDKIMIKVLASTGNKQKDIARDFNTSQGEVSAIKVGTVPVNDNGIVKDKQDEIANAAADIMLRSLGFITDDKLADCSATKLSVIAANAGRVVEKIQPRAQEGGNVQIVVYCPEQRELKDYTVIEA